jgi:hypothetical protein
VDDEGDGDAVREGDGEPELGGLGDFDGRGEDAEREGASEVAGTCDGAVLTEVGT